MHNDNCLVTISFHCDICKSLLISHGSNSLKKKCLLKIISYQHIVYIDWVICIIILKLNHFKKECSFALSFYRSLNVLCPSKIFFLSQPKNLTEFSAYSKTFVLAKKQFYWMQIIFLPGKKYLWLTQYVNEFLVWHKKFGPAQSILGSVKGQGRSF